MFVLMNMLSSRKDKNCFHLFNEKPKGKNFSNFSGVSKQVSIAPYGVWGEEREGLKIILCASF